VSKFDNDSKKLWFVAARHSDQENSPTFKTVKKAFDELRPQVIIIEGVEDTGVLSPPEYSKYVNRMASEHFKKGGEPAYAAWLGIQNNIPYAPSEPTNLDIARSFEKKGQTRKDYAYFEIARFLPQWKMTDTIHNWNDYKKEANKFAGYEFKNLGIHETFNFEDFLKWCRIQLGHDLNYNAVVDDFSPQTDRNPTGMNRLSKEVDGSREPHIHEVTVRMLNQYDRVLIVFGSGHLVKHRAALTKLLGNSKDEQWFAVVTPNR
jgi:hypothetical protein